jgi:hypothetical protein
MLKNHFKNLKKKTIFLYVRLLCAEHNKNNCAKPIAYKSQATLRSCFDSLTGMSRTITQGHDSAFSQQEDELTDN